MTRPRLGVAAAVLTTAALGAALLVLLGAPMRLVLVNVVSAVGAAMLAPMLVIAAHWVWRHPVIALSMAAAALWATALWGADVEGVRRWAQAGPLLFHVGFLVLPVALAVLPRTPWFVSLLALAVLAGALVAEPDGGSGTALAAGAAGLAAMRRTPAALGCVVIAGLAAVAAWRQPDPLAAVPFVEGVAALAVSRSPLVELVAVVALGLPWAWLGVAAWRSRSESASALAGFWFGATSASLIGNFPTPIAGAGMTPILAYAFTWALMGARPDAAAGTRTSPPGSPASEASPL